MTLGSAPPRLRREHGLLLLFIVVTVGLSLGVPNFATSENLFKLIRSQAHLAVLAAGMTLVILIGGIDLSVGSIVALAGVMMGLVWKATGNGPLTVCTALGVGAACGMGNGALVSMGRMPPLIVTLATLSVYRGLAFAFGRSDTFKQFPEMILSLNRTNLLGLPTPAWIIAAIFAGLALYLTRTRGGRAVYAVGLNAAASRLSGVPVHALRLRVYATSGLLAGLAALLYAAGSDSTRADIGSEYELQAITIVVLGGTSVAGGEGSIAGTVLGFLTLVFIQKGMQLSRLPSGAPFPSELHSVVVAVLLIGALLLDGYVRRRAAAAA